MLVLHFSKLATFNIILVHANTISSHMIIFMFYKFHLREFTYL